MKNSYILFFAVILISSCTVSTNIQYSAPITELSNSELANFKIKDDQVLYMDKAVAKIGNFEYEYHNGKYTMEVSLIQNSAMYNEMTEKIVAFMATRYPNAKIEVKVNRDHILDQ